MKRLIIFLLLFAAFKVAGQTTGYLRFDTVLIYKQGGTAELVLMNKTKDSLGVLVNYYGGRTRFMRSRAINDSTIVVGLDTMTIRFGSGSSKWEYDGSNNLVNKTFPGSKIEIDKRLSGLDSGYIFTSNGIDGSNPGEGTGYKTFWHPGKAALRNGFSSFNAFNNSFIGTNSLASGYDVIASGNGSFAAGVGVSATGVGAASLGGGGNLADGNYSLTAGAGSHSAGEASIALGYGVTAGGMRSFATGDFSGAGGVASAAFNSFTSAGGENSATFNELTRALGKNAFVAGFNNYTNYTAIIPQFVIGKWNDTTNAAEVFRVGGGIANWDRRNLLTIDSLGVIRITNPPDATTGYTLLVNEGGVVKEVDAGDITGGSGDTTYTEKPLYVRYGTNDTVAILIDEQNLTRRASDSALSVYTPNMNIPYGDANNLMTSTDRHIWNNSLRKLSIKKNAMFNTPVPDKMSPFALDIVANSISFGDSTSNKPPSLLFQNSYGAANNTPLKYVVGPSGTEEFNIWVNGYYDSASTHRIFDLTKFAQWLAFNPHYFLMQANGIGYAWNDNAGSKVAWRFDNIESGNRVLGAKLTVNQLDIPDYTTTDYQNQNGRTAQFRNTGATLHIGGMQAIRIPDTTQVFVGSLSDTGPILGLSKSSLTTQFMMRNDDNNNNTNLISLNKRRVASYGITQGDRMGAISFNTLTEFGTVANANTISAGAFRLGDFYWNTTNAAAATAERMRLEAEGSLLLGTSTAAASSILTMSSTTRGFLPPRLTTAQQDAITSPATGCIIYNLDSLDLFHYNGSAWDRVGAGVGGGGGASPTASNGLSIFTNDLQWGGVLSASNYIDLNGNIFRFYNAVGTTRFKIFSSGETVIPVQLLLGDSVQNDATNLLELHKVGADTRWGMYNTDNNANQNYFRFIKNRSGSYNLTDGDVIGAFDYNTLGDMRAIAGGTATGGFKPFHFVFRTTNNSGTLAERFRINNEGNVGINTTGPDRKLDILDAAAAQLRLSRADGTQYMDFEVNSSGNLALTGSNSSPFLALGGTSSAFAGFLRDGASIAVRNGDNSAYAPLKVLDEAYSGAFDGSIEVVTKNAFYDKMESLNIVQGTYTPTLTNSANLDASTVVGSDLYYERVGNRVTVYGVITIDATAASTTTTLGISLPIASSLTALQHVSGQVNSWSAGGSWGTVLADATNDRAQVDLTSGSNTSEQSYTIRFTYLIL